MPDTTTGESKPVEPSPSTPSGEKPTEPVPVNPKLNIKPIKIQSGDNIEGLIKG